MIPFKLWGAGEGFQVLFLRGRFSREVEWTILQPWDQISSPGAGLEHIDIIPMAKWTVWAESHLNLVQTLAAADVKPKVSQAGLRLKILGTNAEFGVRSSLE